MRRVKISVLRKRKKTKKGFETPERGKKLVFSDLDKNQS